ncbi:hypothetical protein BC829DRAFT_421088 [Chytridium lagenaria]|nr:hypothetical protein BC829DRAFT_421088 [Chytridium lagenaria]
MNNKKNINTAFNKIMKRATDKTVALDSTFSPTSLIIAVISIGGEVERAKSRKRLNNDVETDHSDSCPEILEPPLVYRRYFELVVRAMFQWLVVQNKLAPTKTLLNGYRSSRIGFQNYHVKIVFKNLTAYWLRLLQTICIAIISTLRSTAEHSLAMRVGHGITEKIWQTRISIC